ncbi:MAG: ADP-ribosyl-[dinitrogen reductase] hydrolase [Pseudomonadota bacterium]|jgi:ADP-ribosyl-[dinitrogen reductase] hydrolase
MLCAGDLSSRAEAAYLGLAIGDALGATVEFLTPREIIYQYVSHTEIIGGGWLKIKAGHVTDDTSMSLALGEAILSHSGKVDALAVAQAFDQWMRSKPIDIGNTVRRNLIRFRTTGETEAPLSEYDAGNGALMRLLPAALSSFQQSEADITAAILAQAHVTHNNPLSDAACLTVTQMIHGVLAGESSVSVQEKIVAPFIRHHPLFEFRYKRIENPSGYVVDTVQAVFQALFESDSFESALIDVVNRGGDADTTGAIVGMLAGALYGLDAIPKRWLKALNPEIALRCKEQAQALIANVASA